jgi:NAD(P)-dependent dehydrogenase (short-subunit alcohol dehydrogenase family)
MNDLTSLCCYSVKPFQNENRANRSEHRAAGGIGSVLVESFLRNDAKVIATDLKGEELTALNPKLNAGARLVTATADLVVEDDCRRLAEFAQQTTGRVNILINCAGYFPLTPFEKISASEWRRIVDINLTGVS